MKEKKVCKLINEILDQEMYWRERENTIIIAKHITENEGKALYYNPTNGVIISKDFDFRDSNKFETDNFKLLRFTLSYWDAAKAIALCFMKENNCGYSLYSEDGIIMG